MKKLTPMKAIRAKCLECCNGSYTEVKECNVIKCALHAYRFGHRPSGNKNIEEEIQNAETPS